MVGHGSSVSMEWIATFVVTVVFDQCANTKACKRLAIRCHVMWGHQIANFLYHYNENGTLACRHLQYQKVHTLQMDEHVILTSCATRYKKCQICQLFRQTSRELYEHKVIYEHWMLWVRMPLQNYKRHQNHVV